MKVAIHWFRRVILGLGTTLILAACGGSGTDKARAPTVRPVKMLTVSAATGLLSRRFPAVVNAGRFSELSFQVGGLLDEVAVTESQEVEEGDLIARLVTRDFENQLNSARSRFQNAEDEYQRAVRLSEQDAIARSVLEQRQTQRDVARAQLDSAQKALDDAVLRAPFSGMVMQVPARDRETVAAGQPIASLMVQGDLEVQIDVPAAMIADSQDVENTVTTVFLDAAPDIGIPAEFKEIDLVANTASQTYAVTFSFEAPETLVILPGMNTTVELSGDKKSLQGQPNRLAVPLAAVSSDGNSRFVWIVDQNTMTVAKRTVTVADGIGESVVVTEGLEPGETIAAAGASFLADGMQVRPWDE